MAPEQLSGQRGHETTATEIYGLGAILYALITRRSPFEADSPAEALARVRDGSPEPPSEAPSRDFARLGGHRPEVPGEGAGAAIQLGRCPGRRSVAASERRANSTRSSRLGHLTRVPAMFCVHRRPDGHHRPRLAAVAARGVRPVRRRRPGATPASCRAAILQSDWPERVWRSIGRSEPRRVTQGGFPPRVPTDPCLPN
jgi:serine/threonine protein kinase